MMPALAVVAALASALLGGVFFAFSSFLMAALERLTVPEGIRAMQRINETVFHWTFMGLFFGTPLLCLLLGGLAIARWGEPGSALVLLGATLHVVGCFVVTAAANVPRNERLAKVDPDGGDDAAIVWRDYVRGWTRWNHVRTVACMAAATALVLGRIAV